MKYVGELICVEIGDCNCICESVIIYCGIVQGGGLMKVGSDNLLMINVYIVYDCMVGNCCIFVNNVMLVGYVLVDDFVIIGGMIVVY